MRKAKLLGVELQLCLFLIFGVSLMFTPSDWTLHASPDVGNGDQVSLLWSFDSVYRKVGHQGRRLLEKHEDKITKPQGPVIAEAPTAVPLPVPLPGLETFTLDPAWSKVRFVLVVGTEGAGHHMAELLLPPGYKNLRDDPAFKGPHLELRKALYDQQAQGQAIFTYPCQANPSPKLFNTFGNAVAKFKAVAKIAASKMPAGVVIPLNLPEQRNTGMVSYPNFLGPCRDLQFPDLDAMYFACDRAGVWCSHLLLVRDPYAVVMSAMRRKFEETIAKQVKLMATMQAVIVGQMQTTRLRSQWCWEYGSTERVGPLGRALGWTGSEDFEKHFAQTFHGRKEDPSKHKAAMLKQPHSFLTAQLDSTYQMLLAQCRQMNERGQ